MKNINKKLYLAGFFITANILTVSCGLTTKNKQEQVCVISTLDERIKTFYKKIKQLTKIKEIKETTEKFIEENQFNNNDNEFEQFEKIAEERKLSDNEIEKIKELIKEKQFNDKKIEEIKKFIKEKIKKLEAELRQLDNEYFNEKDDLLTLLSEVDCFKDNSFLVINNSDKLKNIYNEYVNLTFVLCHLSKDYWSYLDIYEKLYGLTYLFNSKLKEFLKEKNTVQLEFDLYKLCKFSKDEQVVKNHLERMKNIGGKDLYKSYKEYKEAGILGDFYHPAVFKEFIESKKEGMIIEEVEDEGMIIEKDTDPSTPKKDLDSTYDYGSYSKYDEQDFKHTKY